MAITTKSIPIVGRVKDEKDIPAMGRWMEEVRRYLNSGGGEQTVRAIIYEELFEEPAQIIGTHAWADGTQWDPDGSGRRGLYVYRSTGWGYLYAIN